MQVIMCSYVELQARCPKVFMDLAEGNPQDLYDRLCEVLHHGVPQYFGQDGTHILILLLMRELVNASNRVCSSSKAV